MKQAMIYSKCGQIRTTGYPREMINITTQKQFYDESLWRLFVEQFREKPDGVNNGWRGEFWGKLMRAASLTYRVGGDRKLYDIITASIEDMLTTQEENGRFSTYTIDTEFKGWDMWARKYVMLGFLYYMDVCKDTFLQDRIIMALQKHADYIIDHVGHGENKIEIYNTTNIYGGMNSCSILEPFVKLYEITEEKRYLDFAEYIISTGFSGDQDIIKLCLKKKKYPYEFKHTKAYEMMSCFEGLLEYYTVTGKNDALRAVVNFVDMVLESDYTLIGSCGCTHELFDNSSLKQTEYSEGVMQETCVTVTLMKLCARLLAVTGDSKYADVIERSGYNALFGAVNSENQSMSRTLGIFWEGDKAIPVAHEPFPFDSYSPLALGQRAKKIGGFMVMKGGRSYGCCASIGGAGTALFALAAIGRGKDEYFVNLYEDTTYHDDKRGVRIYVNANLYKRGRARIRIRAKKQTKLYCRVPQWTTGFSVTVNGQAVECPVENGYAKIKVKDGDTIMVYMAMMVYRHVLNDKVAFERGPIVFARDERFAEDIKKPIAAPQKSGYTVAKIVRNEQFHNNETLQLRMRGQTISVCDYASAGKNYDSEKCTIAVWNEMD